MKWLKLGNNREKYFLQEHSYLLAASEMDVENLKNESFPNKTIYSSFQSVETTDFKNAI